MYIILRPRKEYHTFVAGFRCAIRCNEIEGSVFLYDGAYIQSVFSVKVNFGNKWKGIKLGKY